MVGWLGVEGGEGELSDTTSRAGEEKPQKEAHNCLLLSAHSRR